MNDTTREVGGALGIAVFGSIVNSLYRANLDLGGLDLPASAAAEIKDSVGGAANAVSQTGVDGGAVLERAATAFTHAFNQMAIISVTIAVAAAVVVLRTFTRPRSGPAAAANTEVGADTEAYALRALAGGVAAD